MCSHTIKPALSRQASAGFTLLEVMVAVAIISIALVTLIGSQSQTISIAEMSRFETMAALLGQQQLAEIVAKDFDDLANGNGDFGEDFPGFAWETEVTELFEDDTGIEGVEGLLKAVDLTVFMSGEQGRSFSLRTIVMINNQSAGS